jgi:rSAM/selenodomain-associated transferase 1
MNTNALIIFVRNPVIGKVKTRIAETAGDDTALKVYNQLLKHTAAVAKVVDADKFVFYSNYPELNDVWDNTVYHKYVQQGPSLGEKMQQAFKKMFTAGYKRVCIIGSDCYELTAMTIQNAFTALEKNDAVIGPAADGGYYLLGLIKLIPAVFNNKEWSTATVCAATITDFRNAGCTYELLPVLNDVDRWEDVPPHFLQ